MGQCTMDRPPDSAIHIHVLVVSDVGLSEGSKRASAAYASAGGPYEEGESCSPCTQSAGFLGAVFDGQ